MGNRKLDWSKVRKNPVTECWEWTGFLDKDGYGPHRRWWTKIRGPIPEGLTLDHLCLNKACVNPDHLEPVTNLENIRRAVASGNGGGRPPEPDLSKRTACKVHGTVDGYWRSRPDGYVYWTCRPCTRQRTRRYKAKQKAK